MLVPLLSLVFALTACASEPLAHDPGDDLPEPDLTEFSGPAEPPAKRRAELPPPVDWQQHWQKVPSTKLPALTPDGSLPDFKLSLTRQIESCASYLAGEPFKVCNTETVPVRLECDMPTLRELARLAGAYKTWAAFFTRVKQGFDFYQYQPNATSVLYTGYNSPLFKGALQKGGRYIYPMYARPADLVNVKDEKGESVWRRLLPDGSYAMYYTRKELDVDRVLDGQGLEIAWFESPADILRLQIEGSGVLEVQGANGKAEIHGVNFAAKNGHPYISVFKRLKEKGVDKKYLTFPGLKQYFKDFPDDMWPTLVSSPSYVFFSVGTEPPCGTARVHVTGGHSLAVDPTQLPMGMVGFVSAERPVEGSDPDGTSAPVKKFSRFAVAQDTGGAIKQAHVDIYWGSTDYAQLASNLMKSNGTLFYLRLKTTRK